MNKRDSKRRKTSTHKVDDDEVKQLFASASEQAQAQLNSTKENIRMKDIDLVKEMNHTFRTIKSSTKTFTDERESVLRGLNQNLNELISKIQTVVNHIDAVKPVLDSSDVKSSFNFMEIAEKEFQSEV